MPKVEFIFDFSSPNCYVANATLRLMMENSGINLEIVYAPVFLGGLFKMTNDAPVEVGTSEFNYMDRNLQRLSALLGIDFKFPRERFPLNTLRALRGFYFIQEQSKKKQYIDTIFRACWVDGLDVSDPATLKKLTSSVGIDEEMLAEFIERDKTKQRLRDDTQKAYERGVFGAPTFFIADDMYWGSPEILWFLEGTALISSGVADRRR